MALVPRRTKNITYDDRDTNNLKYGPNWFNGGIWNASNVGETGTLSSSDDLSAFVTFNFPVPAIAFHYFGMLRSNGGLYGICIDCEVNMPNYQDIDALNTTDDGKNPPVALFSKRFDIPAQHVVVLRNKNDTRIIPTGSSQIAVDRFILEIVDDSPIPITSSPSPATKSDSGKSGAPVGVIVGAIGGFLLVVILIVVALHCRHHRKRHQLAFAHDDVNTDISETSFPTIVPYSLTHPSLSKEGRPKAGESRRTPRRPPSPTPSSGSAAIVTYFRFRSREGQRQVVTERRPQRQREADAGPIPAEDEESTLPPLYEQVFRAGPSNRPPSGEEPNGQSQPISFVIQTQQSS
ncbi:hypothetical protein PQX77_010978 [Marasmius sp. AFHP31]|nr:hypothetical protein PQX77_010978 [Marasmius sp. AFHP31]